MALRSIAAKYIKVFSLPDEPLNVSTFFTHEIRTSGLLRAYPIPIKYRDEIRHQIEDMLVRGVIHTSRSPYNSSLILVVKKNGSLRLCLDFRAVNKVIEDDCFPLPNIDHMLRGL